MDNSRKIIIYLVFFMCAEVLSVLITWLFDIDNSAVSFCVGFVLGISCILAAKKFIETKEEQNEQNTL